ncbi:NACHT and WD40 repeat domain-containing protein [Nocardiopsis alba]|uniref:NACHT and WD40 repeat domain-containing protein n=1 Tax=Nocardiopsis alba TaxID=53437 RepID=UPI003827E6BB
MFTLAVLDQDTDENPVPVLLSVAGWDPTQRIEDWCVRRIVEDHPDFGANGTFNPDQVSDLLLNRRIVPVLDGLDEMPRPVLSTALADLDRAAEVGLRMVLTCRSAEFEQAVHDHGALAHAAVIDIEPIRAEDIAAYLTDPEVANTSRWSLVIDQIRRDPSGPLAHALSTPLMVNLARSIYRAPSSNPEELTKFTTPTITNHLLEKYLSTEFTADEHKKSRHWLSFLSHHLQERGGPNLEWWHLTRAVPRWVLALPIILLPTMCGSILLGLYSILEDLNNSNPIDTYYIWTHSAIGATLGSAVGILAALRTVRSTGAYEPPYPQRRRFGAFRDTLSDIRILIVILCVLATSFLLIVRTFNYQITSNIDFRIAVTIDKMRTPGIFDWWPPGATTLIVFQATLVINLLGFHSGSPKRSTPNARRLIPSLAAGMTLGLACAASWAAPELALYGLGDYFDITSFSLTAIMIGIPTGLGRWLSVPVEEHKASSPMAVLRGDRTALLTAALSSGALTALGFVIATIYTERISKLTIIDWAIGGVFGLAIIMVVVVGSSSAWLSYTIARIWLACRGRLPWRLMRFLRTAHEKGVLRQVGPAYQLRHELLRVHLVEQQSPERHSSPIRRFKPHRSGVRRRWNTRVRPWWHGTITLAATVVLFMGTTSALYFDNAVLRIGTAVDAVKFSPDSQTVAITAGHHVYLWDAESRNLKSTASPLTHNDWVTSVEFSPNSKLIATTSYDGTVQLWDTTTGQPTTDPITHNGWMDMNFSPGNNLIATTSYDGTVQLWDATTGQPTTDPITHNGQVSVNFSPGNNLIAITNNTKNDDGESTVQLWDATTGQPTTDPITHNGQVSVNFSPDNNLIAITSTNANGKDFTRLWDAG